MVEERDPKYTSYYERPARPTATIIVRMTEEERLALNIHAGNCNVSMQVYVHQLLMSSIPNEVKQQVELSSV